MKKENLNKKGFTLIEMMVVVLIIGILAAIALPQYRKAVRKSRVAEAKIVLKAIIDAADRYFLTTGETTYDLNKLDIEVPTESKNWDFYIDECLCGSENTSICGCVVEADPKGEARSYRINYWSVNYYGGEEMGFNGYFTCEPVEENDDNAHKICQGLGGQLIEGLPEGYATDFYQI